jgi:hypothetical protein
MTRAEPSGLVSRFIPGYWFAEEAIDSVGKHRHSMRDSVAITLLCGHGIVFP